MERPNSLPAELRARLDGKRLIFSFNPGRAGSQYAAVLLARIPNVSNHHEPYPQFDSVMRYVQSYPEIAHYFWVYQKLPAILQHSEPIYFEASHLFIKGFVEPLLDLGVVPDVVVLARPNREVALSHLRIGSVPTRTRDGKLYLLGPDDPVMCPVNGWQDFTDYQLCYWYTLEIQERTRVYQKMIEERGGLVVNTSIYELRTPQGFKRFVADMKLPMPPLVDWAVYYVVRHIRIDVRGRQQSNPTNIPTDELQRQEEEVHAALSR